MANGNPDKKGNAVKIALAVALLAVAVVITLSRSGSGRVTAPSLAWYYDLGSGKLFAVEPQGMPPIDAPVGGPGQGVIAHVYGCGSCDEGTRQIVAIETLTEAAQRVQAKLAKDPQSVSPEEASGALATGRIVAAPPADGTEPTWVVASSAQGYALLDKTNTLCDGKPAQRCTP